MAYPLGTLLQLEAQFEDSAGVLRDPTTVTLYVQQPAHVTVTQYTLAGAQVTRVSTGVYTYDLLLSVPGTWLYCWEGTGAVQAATPDTPIPVSASALRST